MIDGLQWIANALITIAMPLLVWCLNHVAAMGRALTEFKLHVAENYVQKPEITKIGNDVAEIRRDMNEILKTLHQIKGSQDSHGRG